MGEYDFSSSFAEYFGPPPAHAYKEKAPVVKELRLFSFEGMTDELENPSEDE